MIILLIGRGFNSKTHLEIGDDNQLRLFNGEQSSTILTNDEFMRELKNNLSGGIILLPNLLITQENKIVEAATMTNGAHGIFRISNRAARLEKIDLDVETCQTIESDNNTLNITFSPGKYSVISGAKTYDESTVQGKNVVKII